MFPHFYKWLGTGDTVSKRTANQKLTKTTNCAYKAKKWRGTTKKKIGGSVPPTFKFVPTPLGTGDYI